VLVYAVIKNRPFQKSLSNQDVFEAEKVLLLFFIILPSPVATGGLWWAKPPQTMLQALSN